MPVPTLIVHGGAGTIPEEEHPEYLQGCREAYAAGLAVLDAGGPALDAVEAAVRALEDFPIFDAGVGSVLNAEGEVALDAFIMDGANLNLGSVAVVQGVPNPVTLARRVMDSTDHNFLAGHGARQYAIKLGLPLCSQAELTVPRELKRFQDYRDKIQNGEKIEAAGHDTVGAVAIDKDGNVAAATSTGGTALKMQGRVGDSPLVGSGGYADNLAGAASSTGEGEYIMRIVMSKTATDYLAAGLTAQQAADKAIALLAERTPGEGGIIVLDLEGNVGFAHNTANMAVARRDDSGEIVAYIKP